MQYVSREGTEWQHINSLHAVIREVESTQQRSSRFDRTTVHGKPVGPYLFYMSDNILFNSLIKLTV
ncbi:MAG: hypothetical protein NPIRA02_05810 [Nitrospirales bacterium]|nr:MAG: hypothetical protein NPIRA02_05810 [Nitrospirales bacterium]